MYIKLNKIYLYLLVEKVLMNLNLMLVPRVPPWELVFTSLIVLRPVY